MLREQEKKKKSKLPHVKNILYDVRTLNHLCHKKRRNARDTHLCTILAITRHMESCD